MKKTLRHSIAILLAALMIFGGAPLAGIAGTMFAVYNGNAFPDYAGLGYTIDSLVMVVIGGVRSFGARGSVRADLVYREFGNFYVTQKDTSTGKVLNANGNLVDLGVVKNNDTNLEREYLGLQTSFDLRATDRLTIGGGYTLSQEQGNFEGEAAGVGPVGPVRRGRAHGDASPGRRTTNGTRVAAMARSGSSSLGSHASNGRPSPHTRPRCARNAPGSRSAAR